MNNYCRNCGEKMNMKNVCEKCGTEVINVKIMELNSELNKKYKKIFWGTVIILIIFLVINKLLFEIDSYDIAYYLYSIERLISLFLVIFIIYAKSKLKVSKFFNIIFWLMLILFILFIVFIILLLLSCEYKF